MAEAQDQALVDQLALLFSDPAAESLLSWYDHDTDYEADNVLSAAVAASPAVQKRRAAPPATAPRYRCKHCEQDHAPKNYVCDGCDGQAAYMIMACRHRFCRACRDRALAACHYLVPTCSVCRTTGCMLRDCAEEWDEYKAAERQHQLAALATRAAIGELRSPGSPGQELAVAAKRGLATPDEDAPLPDAKRRACCPSDPPAREQ